MSGLAVVRNYLKIAGLVMFVFITQTAVAGKTIYVDDDATGANNGSKWADAYNYLQDALADANSAEKPVEIRVAQGVYRPDQGTGITPGDRQATFRLINGVAIRGGYAGFGEKDPDTRDVKRYETILSGDLASNDADVRDLSELWEQPSRTENSYHLVIGSNTDATAILDGFTITAGHADRWQLPDLFGGGMYNDAGGPCVLSCKFSRNFAEADGGAVYNIDGNPTLRNCIFERNKAGSGGAMYNIRSDPELRNGIFHTNVAVLTGGGICNAQESEAVLVHCVFSGNSAHSEGGGMANYQSSATLTACTFAGNTAHGDTSVIDIIPIQVHGGGLNSSHGDVNVINCIFWSNTPDEIYVLDGRAVVTYSDIGGAWPGEGNMNVDPCFFDAGHWEDPCSTPLYHGDNVWFDGDYHLKSDAGRYDPDSGSWVKDDVTSPCIDAGDPASPVGQEPFPNGGRINMGAYGGTAEASKSYFGEPVCQTIIAGDINGDCKVDFQDLAILASHWLEDNTPPGPVTSTYEFLPDQSTMVWHVGRAGWSIPHSIEGQFKLMVDFDAGIARLEQVDAVLTNGQPPPTHPGVNLNGRRLDDCFHMTELISKDVSLAAIYFEGVFEDSLERIVMELKLLDHSVHLTATTEWSDVVHDASIYSLDAVAVVVTEP